MHADTSSAVERARLYDDLQRTIRDTLLINRVIAASAATRDPQEVLTIVCTELAQAFGLPQAAFALLHQQEIDLAHHVVSAAAPALENAYLHATLQEELAERRRAEEALRASNAFVTAILESITDAFFAVNTSWEFT